MILAHRALLGRFGNFAGRQVGRTQKKKLSKGWM